MDDRQVNKEPVPLTAQEDRALRANLRIADEAIQGLEGKFRQRWNRYFRRPSDGQVAFYRSNQYGMIYFDQDSVFRAEQLFVYTRKLDDNVQAVALAGQWAWLQIQDMTSNRNLTEGRSLNLMDFQNVTDMPLNYMVPPQVWAPTLYGSLQFDHVHVVPVAFQVPRAGVLQVRFWLDNTYGLDPYVAAPEPLHFPVTLVGYKVYA